MDSNKLNGNIVWITLNPLGPDHEHRPCLFNAPSRREWPLWKFKIHVPLDTTYRGNNYGSPYPDPWAPIGSHKCSRATVRRRWRLSMIAFGSKSIISRFPIPIFLLPKRDWKRANQTNTPIQWDQWKRVCVCLGRKRTEWIMLCNSMWFLWMDGVTRKMVRIHLLGPFYWHGMDVWIMDEPTRCTNERGRTVGPVHTQSALLPVG